jgi:hypothetical protein
MGKVVKMKRLKGKGDRFFGAGRQATEPFSKKWLEKVRFAPGLCFPC